MKRDLVDLEPAAPGPVVVPPLDRRPALHRPSVPRGGARRLTQGRGAYVDDIRLPRMAHVVFWRSPGGAHAHRRGSTPSERAAMPGVLAVVDGTRWRTVCKPWVATLGHLAGMKSAPQYPLAVERACWQGEPVVAVVAETRAQAEDALQ